MTRSHLVAADKNREWWEAFWDREEAPLPSSTGENWYDVVWRFSLERMYELFQRTASGKKMLECGCGGARVSQYMGERGYACTLLDYSERALSLAHRRFEARSLHAAFVRGDMRNLCLPDDAFDIVYCGGVLEYFADIERPIGEMARVLKPGGILAAHVVPPKFSIQSIADLERTVVYSARNLLRGQFRSAFRVTRMVPRDYGVRPWSLRDYLCACADAGLTEVCGRVTGPFPALALPRALQKHYARVMTALMPQWRRFDDSTMSWTEIWGLTYTIYGRKPFQRGTW